VLQVRDDQLRGVSSGAPLSLVSKYLARAAECDLYLDRDLLAMPVNFHISRNIAIESAIRSIIKPHNCAFLYSRDRKSRKIRIRKIWIFGRGDISSKSFAKIENRPQSVASGTLPEVPNANATPADAENGGRIDVRQWHQPDRVVRKGFLGAPVVRFRHRTRGPRYAPSLQSMVQARRRHTQERKMREERAQTALSRRNGEIRDIWRHQRADRLKTAAHPSTIPNTGVRP
jgi:hypothetical protein